MQKQLSVVCPQCKQGLTIDFENRNMAITCPDCEKLFRIGNVIETVVAKKSSDPSFLSNSSISGDVQPIRSEPARRPRASESWQPVSSRSREFTRRRPKEMSDAEEALQAGGYFMMVISIIGSLLPAIDFTIGQMVIPPIPCMALCLMAGFGGVAMILIANIKHNLPVAIAWSAALLILALMIWVLSFDISRLESPFRYAGKDKTQQLDNEDQAARSGSGSKRSRGLKIRPRVSSSNRATTTTNSAPKVGSANSAESLELAAREDDRLLVREFEERPSKGGALPSEKKLDDLQRQFGSEGTIKGDDNNWEEVQQDLEIRFNNLNQTSILGGVAQSNSFNKKYVLSSVIGKQTNFGDALYDGNALRGVDVSMGRTKSGLKYVLPIQNRPTFSNSLFAEGYFLTGLNVHINEGRLVGLQCLASKGEDDSDKLDESDRIRTPWRGLPIKGPASVSSGGEKIYGLVTYSELGRIVGIQLILKR